MRLSKHTYYPEEMYPTGKDNGMDYHFYISGSSGEHQIYTAGGSRTRYVTPFTIQNGNKYKIWRRNGNIEFYVNNTLDRSFVDQYPNRPMYLEIAFAEPNRKIKNLYIYKEVRNYYEDVITTQTLTKAGDYRYGFQGQEHDDEVKGKGNSINYTYRMHDPRLGRFFAVDPLAYKYPYYSPYAFSGNRVIDAVELEGLEPGDPLIDFLVNSVKSYVNQVSKAYIENVIKVITLTTLNYIETKIDNTVSYYLIDEARKRNSDVENLDESGKQIDFRSDSRKTQGILLYEFATGTGEQERTFSYPDPIVNEIASGYVLNEIVSEFKEHLKTNKLTVNEWASKGEVYKGDIPFSPDHTGVVNSVYRHVASNSSQFLIGGAVYTVSPTPIEGKVNITIVNNMSRNSLMLHQLDNKDQGDLRTTTQKFEFGLRLEGQND